MVPTLIQAVFSLGVKVAEHVHGIDRRGDDGQTDKIYEALKAVVAGDLSLMDTPEELIAKAPKPPPSIKPVFGPQFYEMIRIGREYERIAAGEVLKALTK